MTPTTNLSHGAQVLSATTDADGQVTIFDLPTHRAGTPGTVTAEQATDWTDQDWLRLARSRQQATRARQRRAGMATPRRPAAQLRSPELRRRTGDWRDDHVDVFVGGHFVTSYQLPRPPWGASTRERVLAAKALPIDFTPQHVVPTRRTGESRSILG